MMSDTVYDALRMAVQLARSENIQTVARLRVRLFEKGYSEPVVKEALLFWANHSSTKPGMTTR